MTPTKDQLGDVLEQLFETVQSRKGASPDASYTASLLADGHQRCAKKFGEEAVEAVIAGAAGDANALTQETADVFFHLLVLMASVGVSPEDVAAVLRAREGVSGHDEKAARGT